MNLILSKVFCLQKLYKFTSFNCSLFNIEQQQDSLIGDGLEGLYWTVCRWRNTEGKHSCVTTSNNSPYC